MKKIKIKIQDCSDDRISITKSTILRYTRLMIKTATDGAKINL